MTPECVVCGKVCGPLHGQTKSRQCAGLLSNQVRVSAIRLRQSMVVRDRLRTLYDTPEKALSREIALGEDLRALPPSSRVLDLYGGGLSAEWITQIRPDLELFEAETNRKLWPALRHDAQQLGFTPIFGDFSRAPRKIDLIWLDFCGEPITGAISLDRLGPSPEYPQARYITCMRQNRLAHPEMRPAMRDRVVTRLFGSSATKVHSYKRAGSNGTAEIWRLGTSYVAQQTIYVAEVRKRDIACWEHEREELSYHLQRAEEYFENQIRPAAGEVVYDWGRSCAQSTCRCKIPDDLRHGIEESLEVKGVQATNAIMTRALNEYDRMYPRASRRMAA